MNEFAGAFETHITVALRRAGESDEPVRRWAEQNAMKYTRILLAEGHTPDQPMLTRRGRGLLSAQLSDAHGLVERLRDAGFTVVRVKVEAAPGNAGVPQTAEEAAALPPGCHFEHHVKVVLADAADVGRVRALGRRHDAHLSRNARRALDDRRHERFLTQRRRGVGRPESRRDLDALVADLAVAGFEVADVEEEFVVHDSQPAADAGWAEGGTAGG